MWAYVPGANGHAIDAGGTRVVARTAAAALTYANGIALSPDGEVLDVGESVTGGIWSYAVLDDGRLGERALLAQVPRRGGKRSVPNGIRECPIFAVSPGERHGVPLGIGGRPRSYDVKPPLP